MLRNWLSMPLLLVVLVVPALASAQLDDDIIYPGFMCVAAESGDASNLTVFTGRLVNTSTTDDMYVECPVPIESNVGGSGATFVSDLDVFLIDDDPDDDISCTAYGTNAATDSVGVVEGHDTSGRNSSTPYQMNFSSVTGNWGPNYWMDIYCWLPADNGVNDTYSSIVAYVVDYI